ncbi:pyridoxamine phosphate oxidase-like protein [Saccharata proteae CBS 121410]|uniref:Pyridoxamine phosphate oxidase-like protein n=1 Tax=Saccharata proteae CBS 121410 TaxID=1314787 RepID=A0A9P4I0U7_9PEZI|nr:pyridoxamine phosphate oxidase-like protein [Saccharata proteae CBS 121410]
MPERQSTPLTSCTLPQDLVQSLENARFLHLATSSPDAAPHISLMNYTYLPSSPYSPSPQIIMTTPPTSQKTANLLANPRVSLLVHDWVSARPPTLASGREASPPPAASRSSLATLLLGMNTAALSRISATINGDASFVPQGSDEEKWLKAQHLANNTFGSEIEGEGDGVLGNNPSEMGSGDGGRGCWVEGEEVRVVLVRIRDARIADWKGGVTDWVMAEQDERPLANGV